MSTHRTPEETQTIFRGAAAKPKGQGWDELYQIGVTPWDQVEAAPALQDFLKAGEVPLPRGRYLVPGCGSGHEVYLYAQEATCTEAIGVDISKTVIDRCNANLKGDAKVKFEVADFFDGSIQGPFALVHDYTFLCAIPPTLRKAWAAQMARLIQKDGVLVALAFPLEEREGGPPYGLSIPIYHELLDEAFEKIYDEKCRSLPIREGRERLTVWRRK